MRTRDIFRLVPRAWPFIRPYKRHLLYLLLVMLPGLPGGLFAIYITRVFFDAVGHGQALTPVEAWMLHLPASASREAILWRACLISGLVALVAIPYGLAVIAYAVWILQRTANRFRVDLYGRLQELSVRFHSEEKIGDAIFRMFQDSAAIPQVIYGLVISPLRTLPVAAANLIELVLFDYRMAAVAALAVPANLALAWAFAAPLRRAFRAEREAMAAATSRIEETLASIRAVKAFGCESTETELYARDNWNAFLAARRARMTLVMYRLCLNTVRGLAFIAALYLGAREVLGGGYAGAAHAAVSLGLFQGSLGVLAVATGRQRWLADLWGSLQDVGIAVARVLEMMAKIPEERVRSGDLIPKAPHASIAFERVTFSYDGRAPVLDEASFEALAGEVTALVGPSGSGKSTVIALLLRFFDPASGRISLDGKDACEFDVHAWRRMIAVALQENPLFTATLRDNILYGRPEATAEQVARAVGRAGLDDFVRSLPAGLDTMLGEKGAKLSTGQAQRIGLARAFLKDSPILVLDEPTSALDSAAEESMMLAVRDWLAEAPGRRIALLATHRLSTATHADRVYRLERGGIGQANPRELNSAPIDEARDA